MSAKKLIVSSFVLATLTGCGDDSTKLTQAQLTTEYSLITCETATVYKSTLDPTAATTTDTFREMTLDTFSYDPKEKGQHTENYTSEWSRLDAQGHRVGETDFSWGTSVTKELNATDNQVVDQTHYYDVDANGKKTEAQQTIVVVWRKIDDRTKERIFYSINGEEKKDRRVLKVVDKIGDRQYRIVRTYMDLSHFDRPDAKAVSRINTCVAVDSDTKPELPIYDPNPNPTFAPVPAPVL